MALDLRRPVRGQRRRQQAASPFPVGEPTRVRIDLTNLARVVDAGRALALVLSWGDPTERTSRTTGGELTVHAGSDGSRLVLPEMRP